MASKGRQSSASLAVASVALDVDQRLMPPANLTPAQRSVWMTVVNSRPAEWFRPEHASLLTQYCRHKVQADIIAQQIEEFDPEWMKDDDGLKRYDKLSLMMDRESKSINALMRSMRLTQQSLYSAMKEPGKSGKQAKPWQSE